MNRRKPMKTAMAIFFSLIFSFSLIGSALAECENPEVLTFSIIPTEETIQELTIYKPVIDYLSKMTGKKVEFYMPTSYSSVVEAMIGKWVDVAVLGPYSYVIANSKDPDAEVFATMSAGWRLSWSWEPGSETAFAGRRFIWKPIRRNASSA